ncbi:hypothetical protein OS493_017406 [Desmophyllum pertusum]|uniref:Uncharacterized protein n=1 Tax=Desmophyllum pertusum TaxID=174260 RepID=A0A9X0DB83_9CNID|nr:hypothetical protein OS493_017406 [Desmophyllum pertusum]
MYLNIIVASLQVKIVSLADDRAQLGEHCILLCVIDGWFIAWWCFSSVNSAENRGESPTNSSLKGSVLTVMVPVEGYKSKLLSRSEVPWPLREISRKDKLKMDTKMVTGNSETKKGCSNCSLEIIAGNPSDSEISQPDKIYAGS